MSGLDLFLDQTVLVRMLVVATAAGISAGLLFDLTAAFCLAFGYDPGWTKAKKRNILSWFIRFLSDILFAAFVAILFLLICYYTSDGQVRSPAVLGMIIGFCGYRLTIGSLIRRALLAVVRFLKRALKSLIRTIGNGIRAVFQRLLYPYVWRPIARLFKWLYRHTVGIVIFRMHMRNTDRKATALLKSARSGFELGNTEFSDHSA